MAAGMLCPGLPLRDVSKCSSKEVTKRPNGRGNTVKVMAGCPALRWRAKLVGKGCLGRLNRGVDQTRSQAWPVPCETCNLSSSPALGRLHYGKKWTEKIS